jgi:hypothetical protein
VTPSVPQYWKPFVGDNREPFPRGRHPGPARLARHLGKQIGGELWEDLQRMDVRSLRIDAGSPEDGPCWYDCCLLLDGEGRLADIWVSGRTVPRKAGVCME